MAEDGLGWTECQGRRCSGKLMCVLDCTGFFFPELQMIVFDKLFQILLNEKIPRVSLFNSPWILCKFNEIRNW